MSLDNVTNETINNEVVVGEELDLANAVEVGKVQDLTNETLDITMEEAQQILDEEEQRASISARMQLARDVANLILNETSFLRDVTRYTTGAIIRASAQQRAILNMPVEVYNVTRENNSTHDFYIDIHTVDEADPLASTFNIVKLSGEDRNAPESWQSIESLPAANIQLLQLQLSKLKAKPGDRFFGNVFTITPAANTPDIIEEMAGTAAVTTTTDPVVAAASTTEPPHAEDHVH